MRVVQTPPRYPPFSGGVEAVCRALSERLSALGDDVVVICADDPRGAPKEIAGVAVRRLWWPFKVANTNITPGLPLALLRGDWDVMHTHLPTPWSADWSSLIARIRGKRLILTFHNEVVGSGAAGTIAWLYRQTVERLTLHLAHVVVVLSEPWRQILIARHPSLAGKLLVIPNGVDVDRFSPPPADSPRTDDVLFVSVLDRFHEFKGLHVLLRAMASIPTARLRVVGDGELRERYAAMARDLRMADRVEFLGALGHDSLADLYRQSAIFVLPSDAAGYEGMPLVVLEAMASGLPVVISDGAGAIAGEADSAGAGVMVAAGDDVALAGALRGLLSDRERREAMGAAGRRHALAEHAWDAIVRDYRAIYRVSNRTASQ